MGTLSQILCLCGAVTVGPYAQPVQSSGFVQYRYEALSGGKYLLRVSTSDLVLDSDDWRVARMRGFAQQFAEDACHGPYQLADVAPRKWPRESPTYTRQFIFRCR
jgi:hypothetical protein